MQVAWPTADCRQTDAYTVALVARHYSVPVIKLEAMYKLSQLQLYEQDAFNIVGCAEDVIPYDSIPAREVKVYSPCLTMCRQN